MKAVKILFKGVIIFFFITLAIVIYITFVERHLLISNTTNISIENSKNIKIVQFTDTQLGEFYNLDQLKKAVLKINKQNADVVVFTGDLIDNASTYEDREKVADVLSMVKAKYAKIAIYGNHDYGGGAVRYYSKIMSDSGFKVLKNSSELLNINGVKVRFFGADDWLLGKQNETLTMSGINKNQINILLLHEPDLADKYSQYPIDLILSGHSHGGQVALPIFGAIKKNTLAKKYNKGLYTLDNERKTKLFVSSGLGNTKLPFRFFNVPEIRVFKFT